MSVPNQHRRTSRCTAAASLGLVLPRSGARWLRSAARPLWRVWLGLLVLGLCGSAGRAPSEYEIKAAFLYNFAKFVEWPAPSFKGDTAPFVLGIVGEDPFGNVLSAVVEHEQVKGRPVEIRRYHEGEDFTGCHLLFISRSEAARLRQLLPLAEKNCILTVGEDPEFLSQGGMINFAVVEKSVRFDINKKAMTQARLKISSKLLAVARAVLDDP